METSFSQLTIEAGIVAVVILIIFTIIHMSAMQYDKEFAMGHTGIFSGVALSAFLAHYVFEYSGGNKKFIEMRTSSYPQ